MLFFAIFSMESLKCKNNDQTCLFQCINISRRCLSEAVCTLGLVASGSNNFIEPRQMLKHEKASMIPIICYEGREFILFFFFLNIFPVLDLAFNLKICIVC